MYLDAFWREVFWKLELRLSVRLYLKRWPHFQPDFQV